jgi:hypothetical protein
MPASAALIADVCPLKRSAPSLVPSPSVKLSPLVPERVIVPVLAVSSMASGEVPASLSLRLTMASPVKVKGMFSSVVCGSGTRTSGASFTGVTSTVTTVPT